MPFKIGSFNLLGGFIVMSTALAGIGAVPWALKYALNQEKPARKDQFERYVAWKGDVYDAEAAPYANTHEFKLDREAMENEWRAAHAAKLA